MFLFFVFFFFDSDMEARGSTGGLPDCGSGLGDIGLAECFVDFFGEFLVGDVWTVGSQGR